MLSIGHRTRIFDVMAQLPPSTVQEIASESNLNERYVKEWLGAMVTGRIIDYDSAANKFSLPKEKAQYLTREKSVYNFAASMQWIHYSFVLHYWKVVTDLSITVLIIYLIKIILIAI